VFYFSRHTFEIRKHWNKNAKTATKRFSCFISVLFQFCFNCADTTKEEILRG